MFFSMEEDIKQCNISAKEVGVKTFLWPQKIKWSQNYFGVKFLCCSIFLDSQNNWGLKDLKVSILELLFSTELSEYFTAKQQIFC